MKAGSSYSNLLMGVSQQVPHNRREGQHTEQINMIPDPVRGLTRRRGSIFQAEALVGTEPVDREAAAIKYRAKNFTCLGVDYIGLYRKAADAMEPVRVYRPDTKAFLTTTADAGALSILANGVAAVTAVGRFLLLAGVGHVPSTSTVDKLAATAGKTVVWIRGGAAKRRFSVKATTTGGVTYEASYTTPQASFPGTLDTTDIPYASAEYAKLVNDRVNTYNSSVTKWIGDAAAASTPAAIAEGLLTESMTSPDGFNSTERTALGITREAQYLVFTNCSAVEVSDDGDGTLIRGVAQRVLLADNLSTEHFYGKVVQVQGNNSKESYYVQAVPKGIAGAEVFGEVIWVEATGAEWTISSPWAIGTVQGGVFYLSGTHAGLATLAGISVPGMVPSTAGDLDSNPPPLFGAAPITYLGTFQDRLLVGSGGKLACSQTADYFAFGRTTVLTLPASDGFEMTTATGTDDLFRFDVVWEKGILIFGDSRQYSINGKVALTPTSAALPTVSSHNGAASIPPVVTGTSVFYAKQGTDSAACFELLPGQVADTTDSFEVSTQLDDYIIGQALEIVASPKPTNIMLRAAGNTQSLWVFSYLNAQDGRRQDAWHRWEFSQELGPLAGASVHDGELYLFFLRGALSPEDTDTRWTCDKLDLNSTTADTPYLDSQRPYTVPTTRAGWAAAFSTEIDESAWFGAKLDESQTILETLPGTPIMGTLFASYFTPTNPYPKDKDGRPILTGRLTVGKMIVACGETAGFEWTVESSGAEDETGVVTSRIVGDPLNLLGRINPVDFQRTLTVGRENKQYGLTISSINWLPLTVNGLDWEGQLFNRTRRI